MGQSAPCLALILGIPGCTGYSFRRREYACAASFAKQKQDWGLACMRAGPGVTNDPVHAEATRDLDYDS
jgi:hypothetical protein